ncbi:hypothetical protein [Shewanella algae]|uniref:hypothetical protein n=1 Tax=Shewanella algae TaxID=38313 RepID=UPI0031F52A37
MFAKRYRPDELIEIIAAQSYSPEIVAYVKKVEHQPTLAHYLKSKPKLGVTGTIAKDYVEATTPNAVPYISTKQVKGLHAYIEDAKYISKEADIEWKKCRVDDGDIVINKSGDVGAAAVLCCAPYKYANSVSDIISIKLSETAPIDRDFLVVYLNSPFGQKQLQRLSGGAIFSHVSLHAIPHINVYAADVLAQKYIGDKVRQAERLRAWANALSISVAAHFSGLVKNPLPARVSWVAKKEDLDPYRINPKQYNPVVLDLIQRAKDKCARLDPLSTLVGTRQIAGGATPKGAQYFDKGILFARVQNVKPLRLDLSDAVYIDQFADEELARSRCAADDIILTITGYPGTASLVTEEDLPVNINQHSVRFNIKDGVDPGYVCAALNSKFLKYQVDRLAIGGTRDALDYPSVGRLLIPRYEAEVETTIGEQARYVNAAIKLSQRLTNAAKLLVEALIEGQLSEAELIAAEQALQAGNDQLDRRLLNRLKIDGVDGQGPALFGDLDELYQLLTQAEGD